MRRALVIAVALAGSLIGAAGAGAADGDLRIGSPQAFESPNPFKAVEAISVESHATIYYDQLGRLKPSDQCALLRLHALAKGVDVSPDGKTITFHLRYGYPLVGRQAVHERRRAWTFNAVLQNKTNQLHGDVEALKSVSAPDENTFVLHLATRDSEFLDKLAIPILPAHVWSKIPIAKLDKVDGPDADGHDGALRAHEVGEARHHDPERNEKYDTFRNDGKLPAAKRILITYYANPDSVYRDVNQGHLDYGYGGQPSWARRAKTDDNKNVQLVSSPARRLLGDRVQLLPADRLADLQRARARTSRPRSCRTRRSARRWPTPSTARSSSRRSTTDRARRRTA